MVIFFIYDINIWCFFSKLKRLIRIFIIRTPASLFLSQLSATISQRISTADIFGDCFNPNYCQSGNMLPSCARHWKFQTGKSVSKGPVGEEGRAVHCWPSIQLHCTLKKRNLKLSSIQDGWRSWPGALLLLMNCRPNCNNERINLGADLWCLLRLQMHRRLGCTWKQATDGVSHCEDKAPERQNLDNAHARKQVKKRPKLVLQHLIAALRHCHFYTVVPCPPNNNTHIPILTFRSFS